MQGPRRLVPISGVLLLFACAAALMASPALGKLPRTYQVTRVDSPDPHSNDRFGDTMVSAGWDINGDGPDDFVVGIGRSANLKGRVFVISGADGSVIREISGPPDDFDGDGIEKEDTPGDPDAPTGFGSAIASIADIGRCTDPVTFEPGGGPGEDCNTGIVSLSDQNTGDGIPEILVGAPGLDVAAESDDRGAVFVVDGDTGAILKRLRAPDTEGSYDFGFGREVLSPGGETACAGTGRGGVLNKCVYGGSAAVQNGDINDQGKPDIIVGAPDYNDTAATNPACTDGAGGGTCTRSGRVYVFYGEALAALTPSEYETSASVTIKNPFAQNDDSSVASRFWGEEMGLSLAPVGDIGSCNQSGTPGSACPEGMRSPALDGQPEYTISVPRADAGAVPDAGLVFVVDGATGTRLDTFSPPEPQTEALFGFSSSNRPPVGNVDFIDRPDIYIPAIGQTVDLTGQGRGYIFSGSNSGAQDGNNLETELISTLTDPTPAKFANFGTSSVGIGDVARAEVGLDSRNEVMVGSFGEVTGSSTISDVQIMSPATDQALQTIADPDQQPASGFGRGLVPLGDVNADAMLDFAVGAPGFHTPTQSNRGRVYLFVSDDSPPPPAPKPPATQQQQQTTSAPTTQVLAGRSIEIEASRTRVTAGKQIRLRGVIEAFTNEVRCERNQSVQIQRRRRGSVLYRTFTEVKSNGGGTFSLKIKPQSTYFYRARLSQTSYCIGVVSPREQVTVRKKPKASSHEQRSRAGKIRQ